MVNSLFKVGRHALKSLSENLLDLLNNLSLGGSIKGMSKLKDEKSYLEALVAW